MLDLKSKPERSEEVLDLDQPICNQVNDGPVTIYKAGQRFSELPGDRRGVSANANKGATGQAPRGVFVVDTNEMDLTIPIGPAVSPSWVNK